VERDSTVHDRVDDIPRVGGSITHTIKNAQFSFGDVIGKVNVAHNIGGGVTSKDDGVVVTFKVTNGDYERP
jgi:hypothetical protein